MEISLKKVIDESGFEEALQLRYRVFVDEQGVPFEEERDEDDQKAEHILAQHQGETVGCGRIVFREDCGKIGRVAVAKEYRKSGIGSIVCNELLKMAEKKGCKKALLHAQLESKEFYKKLGFKTIGSNFMEAGIEHIKMVYNL